MNAHARPRRLDLRGGTGTGVVLKGYDSFKAAPVGTAVIALDGHFAGTMHVKTTDAFWSSFHGDWASIPGRIGKLGGGVSPNPGGSHLIVRPPRES